MPAMLFHQRTGQFRIATLLSLVFVCAVVFAFLTLRRSLETQLREDLSLPTGAVVEVVDKSQDRGCPVVRILVQTKSTYRLIGAIQTSPDGESEPKWSIQSGWGGLYSHPWIRLRTGKLFTYFCDAKVATRPTDVEIQDFIRYANSQFNSPYF